jgi:hypothetical protein
VCPWCHHFYSNVGQLEVNLFHLNRPEIKKKHASLPEMVVSKISRSSSSSSSFAYRYWMLIKPLGKIIKKKQSNLHCYTLHFFFRLCFDDRRPRLLASQKCYPAIQSLIYFNASFFCCYFQVFKLPEAFYYFSRMLHYSTWSFTFTATLRINRNSRARQFIFGWISGIVIRLLVTLYSSFILAVSRWRQAFFIY